MLQPVTTTQTLTADRSWLASLHGTDQTDSITLDVSTFAAGTHFFASTDSTVPYSRFLSGVPVGKITASGLYGLYATGATDGRQNLAGFVFAEVLFNPTQTKVPAALLWHGSVRTAKLPVVVAPVVPSATCQIRFV
ncbi:MULTISPECIES: head decoration protein [unclassified Streptomyces]|uniref:head decoration protein n=1 Tax=unclassified Streptomyces TaxID=2593676 RepID=UPI0029A09F74|nr:MULTISPECIES: head decoration protein [unclassified Streptomyces]MDX3766381.1 head decoration protein [Streptomyces sp. AK08-01B]MDX3816363.1 head decoration protein [Streptomyces sp. AK08-01A]